MADSQISRVLVPCFVIQLNQQQFITDDNILGQVLNVPCRDSFVDEVLYWGVPVKDEGMFTAIQWILATGTNAAQPTFDSFLVQRIRDKLSNFTWWVYVLTKNDFKNSCNSCGCDDFIPMPGITGNFLPQIAPCQKLCAIQNDSGAYGAIFGLPTLPAGEVYFPFGSYNNVSLFAASGSGYASISALLAFMNLHWTNIGSPNVTFVWTASGDGLTLTATGGNIYDNLCVVVEPIVPSP